MLDVATLKDRDHFEHEDNRWIRTSAVSKLMRIDHGTLNRDCRQATLHNTGNLRNLNCYVCWVVNGEVSPYSEGTNGAWYLRQDIDEVYAIRAPGKAGRTGWFYAKDLQYGPRPNEQPC